MVIFFLSLFLLLMLFISMFVRLQNSKLSHQLQQGCTVYGAAN